jgi:hypothetical protein
VVIEHRSMRLWIVVDQGSIPSVSEQREAARREVEALHSAIFGWTEWQPEPEIEDEAEQPDEIAWPGGFGHAGAGVP